MRFRGEKLRAERKQVVLYTQLHHWIMMTSVVGNGFFRNSFMLTQACRWCRLEGIFENTNICLSGSLWIHMEGKWQYIYAQCWVILLGWISTRCRFSLRMCCPITTGGPLVRMLFKDGQGTSNHLRNDPVFLQIRIVESVQLPYYKGVQVHQVSNYFLQEKLAPSPGPRTWLRGKMIMLGELLNVLNG